jgi:YD repeat-containing protein
MKVSYDSEVDALSIVFRDTTVTTKPLGEGIAVEYDQDGRLVGIEVLDAVKRFGDAESFNQVLVEGFGPVTASRRGHMVVAEEQAAYGTQKAPSKVMDKNR